MSLRSGPTGASREACENPSTIPTYAYGHGTYPSPGGNQGSFYGQSQRTPPLKYINPELNARPYSQFPGTGAIGQSSATQDMDCIPLELPRIGAPASILAEFRRHYPLLCPGPLEAPDDTEADANLDARITSLTQPDPPECYVRRTRIPHPDEIGREAEAGAVAAEDPLKLQQLLYLDLQVERGSGDANEIWTQLKLYIQNKGSISPEELDQLTTQGKFQWLTYDRLSELCRLADGVGAFFKHGRQNSPFVNHLLVARECAPTGEKEVVLWREKAASWSDVLTEEDTDDEMDIDDDDEHPTLATTPDTHKAGNSHQDDVNMPDESWNGMINYDG